MFEHLIKELKKVKSEKDLTPHIVEQLFNESIVAAMETMRNEEPNINPLESISVIRMQFLSVMDDMLIQMTKDGALDNYIDE